jgi:hypothetical protein
MVTDISEIKKTDLQTPVRNRYFFGKLLDVYHFELETNYVNAKRWLLNRLALGVGVVCGLDVLCGPEPNTVVITPGVAIDKWGREIIVPQATDPITIPADLIPPPAEKPPGDYPYGGQQEQGQQKQPRYYDERKDDDAWVKVMLCYHECEGDPVPVMAGDCRGADACAAGTIREKYRVTFQQGRSKSVYTQPASPDFIPRDRLDYEAVVRWVTDNCPEPPRNPCITLANVRVAEGGHGCNQDNIDIYVRPIVYSNDLLYNLILSLLIDRHERYEK